MTLCGRTICRRLSSSLWTWGQQKQGQVHHETPCSLMVGPPPPLAAGGRGSGRGHRPGRCFVPGGWKEAALRPPDAGAEGVNTWPGKRWGPHCELRKGRWALKRGKQPASSLLGAEADFCPKCGSETLRPQGLAMKSSRKAGCVDRVGCVDGEGNNCTDGWELENSGSVLVDQSKDIAHTHMCTHYPYHADTLLIPYTLHTHTTHTT